MNVVLDARELPGSQVVQIVEGDLTLESTDAIVNAANEHLMHGAGVAGAILRAGGPEIQKESDAWVKEHGPVSQAHPAWTSGGKLPAKYVIHAVGPVWGEGDEDAKLRAAIEGSLSLADRLKAVSISFPAISTGIFGFPKKRAAQVMLSAISTYFSQHTSAVKTVRVVLFDGPTIEAFRGSLERVEPQRGMISSSQNSKVKLARALAGRSKERRESHAFIAEGVRLVEEALAADWAIRFVLHTDGLSARGIQLLERTKDRGIETDEVEPRLLTSISDTETTQGLLAVLEYASVPMPRAVDWVLVLDAIREPGNVGTLLRSAEFGRRPSGAAGTWHGGRVRAEGRARRHGRPFPAADPVHGMA